MPHIQARVPKSYLFSFKRLLVDWKFAKSSIYVDTNTMLLTVEGNPVVQATVKDFQLNLQWLDAKWREWPDLREDPNFMGLQVAAQERLNKAKATSSKGKGKTA